MSPRANSRSRHRVNQVSRQAATRVPRHCCPIFEQEDVNNSVGSYGATRFIPTLPTQDPSVFTGRNLVLRRVVGRGCQTARALVPCTRSSEPTIFGLQDRLGLARRLAGRARGGFGT
jgi:hypothetical protein